MPGRAYTMEELQLPVEPEIVDWEQMQEIFARNHKQGEHVSIVGKTGYGKTTLGLELCKIIGRRMGKDHRPTRVTVLQTKPRDDTLRLILPEKEWPVISHWPPNYGQEHVVIWPKADTAEKEFQKQRAVFLPLLNRMYKEGSQTVYVPEASYFERKPPDGFGASGLMTKFWTAARSNKLTLISDTQRPRWVTVSMWTEPSWIFVFRMRDELDTKRIAQLTGRPREVWSIAPKLGPHEFMLIRDQVNHEEIYVSRVDLVTRNKRNRGNK